MSAVLQPAIDHVVINVGDKLDEAAERYARLGFQLTERGHHSLGSSNNLAIFGTDYLELLGFEPGRAAARPELLSMPAGLGGLVFKPSADTGFRDRVAAAGLPVQNSQEFVRPVALPDGTSPEAHFRVTHLGPEVTFGGRVFFCHHFTPELVWRPEWQRHANGVTGIAEFGIVSDDPERAVAPYRALFGNEAVRPVAGGMAIQATQGAVLVLLPEAARTHWGESLPELPSSGERMVALTFHTGGNTKGGLDATRAALQAGAVPMLEKPGRILVPASEACGVALAFLG